MRSALSEAAQTAHSVRILAAWATCGAGLECLRHCDAAHKQAIIGTAFAGTEPEAFHSLIRMGFDVRAIDQLPNCATFHPKLYLFEQRDGDFTVILGSANLTDAAFTRNAEALVRLSLPRTAALPLIAYFTEYWTARGTHPIDDLWFEEYTKRYKLALATRAPSFAQTQGRRSGPQPSAQTSARTSDLQGLMQSDWGGYVQLLSQRSDMPRDYLDGKTDSYLQVLSMTSPALRAGLVNADRRAIARILGQFDCGWLGTERLMRGRGAQIYNDQPLRQLVDDYIRPLWETDVESDCIGAAESVFIKLAEVDGLGPAFITRILTIARPDRFYSCNAASRTSLASLFGVSKSKLGEWSGYRTGLEMIYSTNWYRSPEPTNSRMINLWKARVALLDSYAYQSPT
ncbi:MAG: phospholipase D family protein [Phycisphaerales bacterium]